MVHVEFTPHLSRFLACPPLDVEGPTVRAALDAVFSERPALKSYLVDDQDRLRKHVVLYVNDRPIGDRIGLSDGLSDGDRLFVFQALSGG
ncbi:MAG: MoaD/ThiS family protein [Pseudomonadota bacterium]